MVEIEEQQPWPVLIDSETIALVIDEIVRSLREKISEEKLRFDCFETMIAALDAHSAWLDERYGHTLIARIGDALDMERIREALVGDSVVWATIKSGEQSADASKLTREDVVSASRGLGELARYVGAEACWDRFTCNLIQALWPRGETAICRKAELPGRDTRILLLANTFREIRSQ